MKKVVVAITGASGSIYAVRLLEVLLVAGMDVHLTISANAVSVFKQELGLKIDLDNFDISQILPEGDNQPEDSKLMSLRSDSASAYAMSSVFSESDITRERLTYHHYCDFYSGIASGSFLTDGMIICPCSTGTMASIANGLSSNLIHRAADVHLKEHRKLIVVPRETPISTLQLANLHKLSSNGAIILPASPGFYHGALTIHDLIDFIVGRICDQLGINHNLSQRWGE
ncbi:Flavin prenyltransferase UbiX [hydrothermal vent metagenome]|uniref:Flavin prenyltransferase UbiX n=1 Tax=hydrothermal vent metagenome TaxID=652676 RepID=A0A3B1E0J3_9ZZZZ